MKGALEKAWLSASSVAQNVATSALEYARKLEEADSSSEAAAREGAQAQAEPSEASPAAPQDGYIQSSDPALEHLLRDVKSRSVRKHFFANPPETYTDPKDVRIWAGTYNIAGRKPDPNLDLSPWISMWDGQWPSVSTPRGPTTQSGEAAEPLIPPGSQASPGPSPQEQLCHDLWQARASSPDILAMGFQEVVPLNAGNVVVGTNGSNADCWDQLIDCHLNKSSRSPSHKVSDSGRSSTGGACIGRQSLGTAELRSSPWDGASLSQQLQANEEGAVPQLPRRTGPVAYMQVASKQLVGLYLTVWAKAELLPHLKGLQATQVATGFGGYLGNKGAVLVRMQVYDTPLLFVCAHLSAGAQDGDELWRNYHVREIMGRAEFPPRSGPGMSKPELNVGALNLGSLWGNARLISDHDNIIWVGDLNYRLQASVITDEAVREHLAAGRLQPLLEADQLLREMEAGRVFTDKDRKWREGPITFYPTYKYHIGGHTYIGDHHAPSGSQRDADTGEDTGSKEGGRETPGSPAQSELSPEAATATLEAAALAAKEGATKAASLAATAARMGMRTLREEEDSERSSNPEARAAVEGEQGVVGGERAEKGERKKKEKRRTPAWCDRVLWLSRRKRLHQLAYNRAEITASDHRPVAAAFLLQASHYNRQKLDSLLSSALRSVDSLQASMCPRCALIPSGTISLGEPLTLNETRNISVKLCNEGAVEGLFHLVTPPGSTHSNAHDQPLPPWLSIEPAQGVVAPGTSCELRITASISEPTLPGVMAAAGAAGDTSANMSNGASMQKAVPLDCIAILRVEDGSDHFMNITGSFLPPQPAAPATTTVCHDLIDL